MEFLLYFNLTLQWDSSSSANPQAMLATSREPQNWEHQHVWQRFERLDKKVLLLTCHDLFSPSKTLSNIETYWNIEASPFRNATKLVWAIHVRFWKCMIETWFPETFVPSFRLCTAFGKASRVALCCRVLAWPMAALNSPMTILKGLGDKHLIEVTRVMLTDDDSWKTMWSGYFRELVVTRYNIWVAQFIYSGSPRQGSSITSLMKTIGAHEFTSVSLKFRLHFLVFPVHT